uniref:Uncharacterized protein n=1 Tax=Archaeoglobus fulgidus TaxID=2234 RepID=A0A7C3MBB7_ARCFL
MGKNFFQFVTENMSAPVKFEILPDIEDDEIVGTVVHGEGLRDLLSVKITGWRYSTTKLESEVQRNPDLVE